jgi:hypothetical protein
MFNGTMTTNQCMDHAYGYINGTLQLPSSAYHTADCIEQTFPAPAYTTTPVAIALLGRVGLSISGGVNIYGPLEAGFTSGQICDGGTCTSGVDLEVCTAKLQKECSSVLYAALPDDCGGHASPYHYHYTMACDYNTTDSSTHSKLVGVALDGRGIYGKWESSGAKPTDLDACNGHYGDVPAYSSSGVSYAAATNVYHYHITDSKPWTLGCFGPVASLTACKALYTECGTGYECSSTSKGTINYDINCPCFTQNGETYNSNYSSTCTASTSTTKAGESAQGIRIVAWLAMLVIAIFSVL